MIRTDNRFPLRDSEGNPWSQARPKPTLQPLRRREPVQPVQEDWWERWGMAVAILGTILLWAFAGGAIIYWVMG